MEYPAILVSVSLAGLHLAFRQVLRLALMRCRKMESKDVVVKRFYLE